MIEDDLSTKAECVIGKEAPAYHDRYGPSESMFSPNSCPDWRVSWAEALAYVLQNGGAE